MKYFYDTEFLENGVTIDLISIGIVAEDGREYYAVNAEANWFRIHSHEWLKANVVPNLGDAWDAWKPKAQIRDEVLVFLLHETDPELWAWYSAYDHVALAQLFGSMTSFPKGLPMYTHDLRAYIDYQGNQELPKQTQGLHNALADARWVRDAHAYAMEASADTGELHIAAHAAADALIAFAEAHRMTEPIFMDESRVVTVGDLLRERADEYRAAAGGQGT